MDKTQCFPIVFFAINIGCGSHLEQKLTSPCAFVIESQVTSRDQLASEDSVAMSSPQPYSPATRIVVDVLGEDTLTVSMFDIEGHPVSKPFKQLLPKGEYRLSWRPDSCPSNVSLSGVYFIRYTLNDSVTMKKIMLLD